MGIRRKGIVAKKEGPSGFLFHCIETGNGSPTKKGGIRVFERHREIMERRKSGEASEYGFTLIELLIVIIVLGILAAIVVFSLSGVTGESKQAACTSDAKSVEIAADAYEAANNDTWPTDMAVPGRRRTCTRSR